MGSGRLQKGTRTLTVTRVWVSRLCVERGGPLPAARSKELVEGETSPHPAHHFPGRLEVLRCDALRSSA
jgi:hypothetical protein